MPRLITRIAACAAIIGAVLWFQPRINEPAAQVSNGLNLRSAPDQRAERLAVLPIGTTVEVQRCLADLQWCNVRADGRSGWVAADYLIARSDFTVPVGPSYFERDSSRDFKDGDR